MGIGKERSKFGRWLDERGISQQWVVEKSGVGRTTVSILASKEDYSVSLRTMRKIVGALRNVDSTVEVTDIFDI